MKIAHLLLFLALEVAAAKAGDSVNASYVVDSETSDDLVVDAAAFFSEAPMIRTASYDAVDIYDSATDSWYQNVDNSLLASILGFMNEDEELSSLGNLDSVIRDLNLDGKRLIVLEDEAEMKKWKNRHLMSDPDNVLFFKSSRTSIYHNETDETWYAYQFDERLDTPVAPQNFLPIVPVTPCVSNKYGDGGSLSMTYSVELDALQYIGGTLLQSVPIIPLAVSATASITLGASFQISGSYSCNVNAGEFGQLFVRPSFVTVPQGSRRPVAYKKFKGLMFTNKIKLKVNSFTLLAKITPHHYCVTGAQLDMLRCTAAIGSSFFMQLEFS